MKKIFRSFLFTIFVISFALYFTTRASAAEYSLSSSEGQVKVVLDSKFGGAITQLYDYPDFGNSNLIDGAQAGAMFQSAFWTLPYHNYQPPYVNNDPRYPPGCSGGGDQFLDNPTQAGYVADGRAGNPIGIMGTDQSTLDPNEFIRYENNNQTVHFKSRFIRYDYCKNGSAPISERQWWDTDFYIEQWASFHPSLPRTLVLRSEISYAGSTPKSITSRQLPVIFAFHLPRLGYWKNGQKVVEYYTGGEKGLDPDSNWAALLASNKEAGIGMVTSANMTAMLGRTRFTGGELPNLEYTGDRISILYPGGGVPDLRTMGTVTNIDYDASSGHIFTFNLGGTFEWTTYYPVGPLNLIKAAADNLLTGTPFNYVKQIPQIHGNIDRVTCNQPDVAGWATDDRNHANKLSIRLDVYPDTEPDNKVSFNSINPANGYRPDLTGVCPPDGKCAFGAAIGALPTSFLNKSLRLDVFGISADGENQIDSVNNLIGPCNNLVQSLPGDLNHDGKVDILDLRQLLGNFTNPSTEFIPSEVEGLGTGIFDYNILVGNFGK